MKRPNPAIGAVEERLHADYAERFFAAGATGFDTWGNGAKIGVEARFKEGFGPVFGPVARYASRPGGWACSVRWCPSAVWRMPNVNCVSR
jgi:hypothetical protein